MRKLSPTARCVLTSCLSISWPKIVITDMCEETILMGADYSSLEKRVAGLMGSGKSEMQGVWIDEISQFTEAEMSAIFNKIKPKERKIKPMRDTKVQVKPFWANDWRKK